MYTGLILFGSIFLVGLILSWFVIRRMNRTEERRLVRTMTKSESGKWAHIK
jgi:hypothetical protein